MKWLTACTLCDWQRLSALFDAALAGAAAPWLICVALALTTLLLEDLAIAAGIAVAAHGSLSWAASFAAVAGGIAAGDVGLYALGLAATRVPALRRRWVPAHDGRAHARLSERLPAAVLLARVVPGLRLLTYTACGWLRIPLLPFCAWVVIAVALWTAALYALGAGVGGALARAAGVPLALAAAAPIVALALAVALARRVRAHRLHRIRRLRGETA